MTRTAQAELIRALARRLNALGADLKPDELNDESLPQLLDAIVGRLETLARSGK